MIVCPTLDSKYISIVPGKVTSAIAESPMLLHSAVRTVSTAVDEVIGAPFAPMYNVKLAVLAAVKLILAVTKNFALVD